MIVLGVTGSIGMGKTTVCRLLSLNYKIKVWNADKEVRLLTQTNKLLQDNIKKAFPEAVSFGKINRTQLRKIATSDISRLKELEEIIHPSLYKNMMSFLAKMERLRQPICCVDVPLLFEVGWDRFCDVTVLVEAPPFIQDQRLFRRKVFTRSELAMMLQRQWPDDVKHQRADFVIKTGASKSETSKQLKKIMMFLAK